MSANEINAQAIIFYSDFATETKPMRIASEGEDYTIDSILEFSSHDAALAELIIGVVIRNNEIVEQSVIKSRAHKFSM